MIKKVNIIGAGNVATHLANHLHVHLEIKSVYSRTFINARILADQVNATPVDEPSELSLDVDLNIICLTDDAVTTIASGINKSIPTVHTSGSVNLDVFNGFDNFGILYPLQTFSKGRVIDVSRIPFFLETSSVGFYEKLERFCHQYLSSKTFPADSDKRAGMHLAAVIANNFSNYLLILSDIILEEYDLGLEAIEPLMHETFNKAFLNGPENSQTGPARRNDIKTIEKHLKMLKDEDQQKVYRLMSELIQKRFKA